MLQSTAMNCLHILRLFLSFCVCLVSVSYCMYFKTSVAKLDVNIDHVGDHVTTNTVLACSRFCNKKLEMFMFFFFSPDNHQCYCSRERLAFPEDLSKEEAILGELKPTKDCLEYHHKGYLHDDYFTIEPRSEFPVTVWCDMENGGWTGIQRRLDGSVDFYRNWTEYARGFGDPDGEMWLGLDNIHALTQEPSELYIYMETFGDVSPFAGYAWYSHFSVADESLKYRLTLSLAGYKGNVSDSLYVDSHGMSFSTYDRDNDLHGWHCAVTFKGAWWYNGCHSCNLNGYYFVGAHETFATGVNWRHPWGYHYSLKKITMKIRRVVN